MAGSRSQSECVLDTHNAVVELYQAMRSVIFLAVPTVESPDGKRSAAIAEERLAILTAALQIAPSKRLLPIPLSAN